MVSYMFDKSLSGRPDTVSAPFCSENPPPEVGIFILSNHIFLWY
jgi:hypothetical protein